MMKVFAENPNSFLDDFSKQFEAGFMDLVRRRWRTKRIEANKVYNEYIQDRAHIHMNATKWVTLTEFVAYLNKLGLVEVEETEKAICMFLNIFFEPL
jgi:DNA/RNA-binding protein KIN17